MGVRAKARNYLTLVFSQPVKHLGSAMIDYIHRLMEE